jgi:hypothetical protein
MNPADQDCLKDISISIPCISHSSGEKGIKSSLAHPRPALLFPRSIGEIQQPSTACLPWTILAEKIREEPVEQPTHPETAAAETKRCPNTPIGGKLP